MEKNFDFKRAEAEINKKWLDGQMFRANVNHEKKPYSVLVPPPNVTSKLHIGHAYEQTILDVLVRFKRMQGFEALLVPGADHAAIATEVKVTEDLHARGIEKSSLTREEFMQHVQDWYDLHLDKIKEQMSRLGLSCDWSRFRFTMDEATTEAVKEAFRRLKSRGLVYQGERMINHCPTCQTALCDAEVEHEPRQQTLYNILFPFTIGGKKGITISTVRPEVVLRNAAIAVNPKDKRYKSFIGKSVLIPITNKSIPIIAEDSVDMKFGTGCLQITPRDSVIDFEIAKKHNLEIPQIGELITRDGAVEKFSDYITSKKAHTSNLAVCYRCHKAVEPTLSKQWFVKMDELAKMSIEKHPNILPKKFEKIYMHWLNNIQDWCISRQLWSGHKIPIDGEEDVLDTWFSSALWPLCTLGWPNDTDDFKYFYPNAISIMGYEIIFFWAIRMIFSGLEYTNKLPFETLVFHGIVRDSQGRKMSKSLGNGIDPLEVIDEYGADALRFSLICGTKIDRDQRYSLEKVILARNFINKIWNATKFFINMTEQEKFDISDFKIWDEIKNGKDMSIADKWICTKLNSIIKNTTRKYEKYDFGVAVNELQTFFWNDVCDWYLETIKVSQNKAISLAVFRHVLVGFLKLLNPVMPFVTEEIYCNVLGLGKTMVYDNFPTGKNKDFNTECKQFDEIVEFIQILRSQKKDNEGLKSIIIECEPWIESERLTLEKLSGCVLDFSKVEKPDIVTKTAKIRLDIDKSAQEAKIKKQIEILKKEIERGARMLSNESFLAKAPKSLVEEEQTKLAINKQLLVELGGGDGV
ncbi:MAG: class I tRNA ligase family protein [Firmicutes bacterium]|nr:class I tRNA ligase family protein [Bacillota bacterium]